jgi:hypothetical protein
MNSTPLRSSARWIDSSVLPYALAPLSMRFIVLGETPANSASSVCDISSKPRAARICGASIMLTLFVQSSRLDK